MERLSSEPLNLKKPRFWKTSFQPSTYYPNRLRQILDLFSRKFQSFSEKLLSKFQKIQNLSIYFIFQLATHVNAEFQLTTCYLDRLRQIVDLFSRKFQSFSWKLLRKFQKSQILSTHLYFSISNA
jgi:hypothetical protein